eukprot:4905363-Pyramimonas_sp.AAC.1
MDKSWKSPIHCAGYNAFRYLCETPSNSGRLGPIPYPPTSSIRAHPPSDTHRVTEDSVPPSCVVSWRKRWEARSSNQPSAPNPSTRLSSKETSHAEVTKVIATGVRQSVALPRSATTSARADFTQRTAWT